ncbi:LOW QUALITY PROTEIN: uncharacterized protein LOC110987739 [Acanthaster planci]|uniref:LOW QUALITY PROTEIN: uncharacterized protein LOC110987739 n=1 Tax=Acanthaster planci TaxID=133434 RepID=A0A8B7ZLX5_ACAPL|nr:LOW QUALITY PROTEIN: uncharacterized protein LOC110987739 [Acanthaster planci]
MAKKDPSATLRYIEEVSAQLSDEVRQLRQGDYTKLFKQTRSFVDGLQRSPKGRTTTYGPSITTIASVRDCYEDSKRLDKDRPTHFTSVIGHFLTLVNALRTLAQRVREWIAEPIGELTVHDRQREAARKIKSEMEFWEEFLDEHNDFTDLHKHKTLEEFRGLNTGEVPLWGAVVNLIPVLLKTADGIAELSAKWCSTTHRLGMGIYEQRPSSGAPGSRPESRARGSSATGGQRPKTTPERSCSGDGRKPRKTYADKMDEKYKGRISLLERPPWKPSSQLPHNLYPQLHIHLGDPTNHVPYN